MEPAVPRLPVLRPHQTDHYNRIIGILQRFYYYVDGSEPGTGKTHVACAVARALNLPVIVVCPAVARVTWEQAFKDYTMPYWNVQNTGPIITYETFRSVKNSQPKHGLLVRNEGVGTGGLQFYPTPNLAHIVRSGAMFIFDECQKLKNNNDAHKAVKAVIQFIYTGAGEATTRSRCGLLSGTILDKEEQAIHFMHMVGFIEHRNLYTKSPGGDVELQGIAELQTWARRINPTGADEFINGRRFEANRKAATDYAFQLFRQIIRPSIMSIMPKVISRDANGRPTATLDIKNGFYVMDQNDARAYQQAVNQLAGAVGFQRDTGTVQRTSGSIGMVTIALTHLQQAKVNLAIRIIDRDLRKTYKDAEGNTRYYKVILFADYYDAIDAIKAGLQQFNILELTGRTAQGKRGDNIMKFNQDDDQYRLLIANPIVGGMSVNLQDLTGHRARRMYLMPGYRINELHQASLRTFRDGTVGEAYVRFIFGLTVTGNTEIQILNALARKGAVMHQMLEEQHAKFPGEYEDDYEVDPRTLFGDDFFERNPRVVSSMATVDISADELANELEEIDLDADDRTTLGEQNPTATVLPLPLSGIGRVTLPGLPMF